MTELSEGELRDALGYVPTEASEPKAPVVDYCLACLKDEKEVRQLLRLRGGRFAICADCVTLAVEALGWELSDPTTNEYARIGRELGTQLQGGNLASSLLREAEILTAENQRLRLAIGVLVGGEVKNPVKK